MLPRQHRIGALAQRPRRPGLRMHRTGRTPLTTPWRRRRIMCTAGWPSGIVDREDVFGDGVNACSVLIGAADHIGLIEVVACRGYDDIILRGHAGNGITPCTGRSREARACLRLLLGADAGCRRASPSPGTTRPACRSASPHSGAPSATPPAALPRCDVDTARHRAPADGLADAASCLPEAFAPGSPPGCAALGATPAPASHRSLGRRSRAAACVGPPRAHKLPRTGSPPSAAPPSGVPPEASPSRRRRGAASSSVRLGSSRATRVLEPCATDPPFSRPRRVA